MSGPILYFTTSVASWQLERAPEINVSGLYLLCLLPLSVLNIDYQASIRGLRAALHDQ